MSTRPAPELLPITEEVCLGGQVLPIGQGLLADLFRRYPAWVHELHRVLPEGHGGLHAVFTLRGGRLWVTGVWVRLQGGVVMDRRVLEVLFFGEQPPVLAWWVNDDVPLPALRSGASPATTHVRIARIRNGTTLGASTVGRQYRGMAGRSLRLRAVIGLSAMLLTPLVCFWLLRGRWPHLRFEGHQRALAVLLSPVAPFLSLVALLRTKAWSRPLPDVVHEQLWMLMTFMARRRAMRELLLDALPKGRGQ